MTDKEIIIDGVKLEDIKNLLFTGQKMAISTKTFEAIIEQLERKTQELEQLKTVSYELQELKAEKEDLKKWYKYLCKFNERLIKEKYEAVCLNARYEQALYEIRESVIDCKQTKISFCQLEEQIQDIINEVLKDE